MNKIEKYLKIVATCAVIRTVIIGFTFLCELLSDDEDDYFLDDDDDDDKVVHFGDE